MTNVSNSPSAEFSIYIQPKTLRRHQTRCGETVFFDSLIVAYCHPIYKKCATAYEVKDCNCDEHLKNYLNKGSYRFDVLTIFYECGIQNITVQ